MSSVPELDSDPRPELPRVFPDGEVTVEGERKTFEESRTNNSTQPKLVYLLDKAPIKRIVSVQGIDQNGENRTFQEGLDYELADLLQTFDETFVFSFQQDRYKLDRKVDSGSISIRDEDGTDYTEGVDFVLVQDGDGKTDTVVWQDGEDRPNVDDRFTASYERTSPDSAIEWDESGDNLPRVGRTFFVTYVADSILNRYLDAYDEEFTDIKEAIDSAVSDKFVDTADGGLLEEIGELFGPVIGKRRGRTDEEYRKYLKSVVQSFISRGTNSGIKLAISASTDIPTGDIEIREDFQENSYDLVIQPNTPVRVSLIENVADIADPSGVQHILTRFPITEQSTVNDDTIVREPVETEPDEFLAQDEALIDENLFTVDEETTLADIASIDLNKRVLSEDLRLEDVSLVDPNLSSALEGAVVDDTTSDIEVSDKRAQFWNEDEDEDGIFWNFFQWMELEDLTVAPPLDTAVSDDSLIIDDNKFLSEDSSQSEDAFAIDANKFAVGDASNADDTASATLLPDGLAVEDAVSEDAVTGALVTPIAWGTNDWGSPNWTVEHN
jgi:hypothetical protein